MKLKILVLFIIINMASSCAKKQIITEPKKDPYLSFFKKCENDIVNAKKVILEKDIIKNLAHLQLMNSGGKKYYLLERENISKMINSVTKGVYQDFILVHKNGKIIYTKFNDDIFGKNVRTSLRDTPLNVGYINRNRGVIFTDISSMNRYPGKFFVFISDKVKGGNTIPGIFILQVDIDKIKNIQPGEIDIIGFDGFYRFSSKKFNLQNKYKYFSKIKFNTKKSFHKGDFTADGIKKIFRSISFKNISWIIITDNDE